MVDMLRFKCCAVDPRRLLAYSPVRQAAQPYATLQASSTQGLIKLNVQFWNMASYRVDTVARNTVPPLLSELRFAVR